MTFQGRGSIDNASWMTTVQGLGPWDLKQGSRRGRRFWSWNYAAHVGSTSRIKVHMSEAVGSSRKQPEAVGRTLLYAMYLLLFIL